MKNRSLNSLLTLLAVAAGLSGCKSEDAAQGRIAELIRLKSTVLEHYQVSPYREAQYQALGAHSSRIAELAYDLKRDAALVTALNAWLAQTPSAEDVCSRTLLSRAEWETIQSRCTKNRFFLCSEELKRFPEILNVIREELDPAHRERLNCV